MKLLQRFVARIKADGVARRLLLQVEQASTPTLQIVEAIDDAERRRRDQPDHFGLTYALGQACERVASDLRWHERGQWLERALGYYEAASRLAQAGRIDGAARIDDVKRAAWEPGLTLGKRALLAASFRAGVLLVAEFRIRNPADAIGHLTRVVSNLRGAHPAWYFLGEAYVLNAQFDEAERAWTEGLARSPGDPTLEAVLRNLPADRVHHAARTADWAGVLREIARLPPNGLPASERWTLEGDAHLALGHPEEARQCWLRALQEDPRAVGVRRRLRKLERLTVL